ncbi:hypothetical protein I317_04174 [Kwoniella heveanensis CBS 569]|nr:hypothetical protein I317_04174 [Kwoniella heveanensis CBS 569]
MAQLVRLYRNRLQKHQAKRDPSVLPSQVQDLNQNRPTLRSVAIDVASHLSPPSQREGDPHGSYAQYHARGVGGVTRVHGGDSTTSLPAYGADSLPVPPNATYNPNNRSRAGVQESVIPLYAHEDAPPKYTASTTQPGITV